MTNLLAIQWGRNIAITRGSLGLNQEKLAELAGTTQQTISRLERGEQVASDGMRMRVAKALGVKVEELFVYGEEGEG